MSRTPSKKPAAEAAAPPKMPSWAIYRLKGTPAALLGHVDAPDAETAIAKAIDEFDIPQAAACTAKGLEFAADVPHRHQRGDTRSPQSSPDRGLTLP